MCVYLILSDIILVDCHSDMLVVYEVILLITLIL